MVLVEVEYDKRGISLGHELNFACLLQQLPLRATHKPKLFLSC